MSFFSDSRYRHDDSFQSSLDEEGAAGFNFDALMRNKEQRDNLKNSGERRPSLQKMSLSFQQDNRDNLTQDFTTPNKDAYLGEANVVLKESTEKSVTEPAEDS